MNQKAYDHIDKLDNEYFNDLRDKYVPGMGAAETRAGEIIRAMDRLIYRFFNDGDMVGKGYGNETCNSSYRYLRRRLGPGCPELQAAWSEDEYVDMLASLCDQVKELFETSPELFTWENNEDSRTPSDEDRDWYREDDDIDDEDFDY
jgi:hypothetical protein